MSSITWTPEARERLSQSMKAAHRRRRLLRTLPKRPVGRPRKVQSDTTVVDYVPQLQENITKLGKEYNKAVSRGEARGPLLTKQELTVDEYQTRFPFKQYQMTAEELHGIIVNRDQSGRNSYLDFWDGFPHGLSDITFETHRRVARILGVERQLANGFSHKSDELRKVMRQDLQDLANYAIFGIMKLDKDATELT